MGILYRIGYEREEYKETLKREEKQGLERVESNLTSAP